MNNYEYIITSLPDITTGWKFGEKTPEDYIEEITSLCSEKDKAAIDFLLEGFDDSKLAPEFYISVMIFSPPDLIVIYFQCFLSLCFH